MKIEVSNGEIIDKLTIIQIKLEHINDQLKIENLNKEARILHIASKSIISKEHPLYQELYEINQQLWDIEDRIRDLERAKDFGDEFVEVARSVYFTNDKRSDVKRKINKLTNSLLFEEKSYQDYV